MPEPTTTITCRYEAVKYGNLIFNSFARITLNHQNVYTEDNLFVKYIRCTLEVDFILSNETIQFTENKTTETGTGNVTIVRGIDLEMDFVREQLQMPNKELVLYYHGAGTKLNIAGRAKDNVVTDRLPGSKNPLAIPYNTLEGPYPEVLSWEPLGANNAARCKWRCVFNIPAGPVKSKGNSNLEDSTISNSVLGGDYLGTSDILYARNYAGAQDIQSLVNAYINGLFSAGSPESGELTNTTNLVTCLLSHTEEQECEIEEDGTAVVTLTGVLEFTGSGSLFNKLKESPTAIPRLLQFLNHYFEPLHPIGFTRTQKYKYKKSRREIEYVITDREIKSDNPIFPNIVKADVSHSVSSNLLGSDPFEGMGFITWNNVFEGTITVRPGVWKGWAWIAMQTIVKQRMKRTQSYAGENFADIKDRVSGVVANVIGNNQVQPRHLLHKISVKENIYNREVNFSMSYMTMHNLNELFLRTGLFFPVHIAWPGNTPANIGEVPTDRNQLDSGLAYNDQWRISRESLANIQNVFGYRGPMLPGYDILFNPYDGQDPNRFAHQAAPRNPERYWVTPNNAIDFSQNANNVDTLAERRRNEHFETFGNLQFPFPNTPQLYGGPSPIKDSVGNGSRDGTSDGSYRTYNPLQDSSYLRDAKPEDTWISYDTKMIVHREETQFSSQASVLNQQKPDVQWTMVTRI